MGRFHWNILGGKFSENLQSQMITLYSICWALFGLCILSLSLSSQDVMSMSY